MIQRIQTVYLALSIVLNGVMFASSLFKRILEGPHDWIWIGISSVAVLSILISLWAIFQYSNRPQQIKNHPNSSIISSYVAGWFPLTFFLLAVLVYICGMKH